MWRRGPPGWLGTRQHPGLCNLWQHLTSDMLRIRTIGQYRPMSQKTAQTLMRKTIGRDKLDTWVIDTFSGSESVNYLSPDMGHSYGCPRFSSLTRLPSRSRTLFFPCVSVLCSVFGGARTPSPGHFRCSEPAERLLLNSLASGSSGSGLVHWPREVSFEWLWTNGNTSLGSYQPIRGQRTEYFGWPVTNEGYGVSLGMWWVLAVVTVSLRLL